MASLMKDPGIYTLGEVLRILMYSKGLTIEETAKLAGISASYLNNILGSWDTCSNERLKALSKVLDVSFARLGMFTNTRERRKKNEREKVREGQPT